MKEDDLKGNEEIEKALKEFEAKEDTQKVPVPSSSTDIEGSKMVQFVIKNSGGLIKDQRQAEYVLLAIVAIFMGISLFLFFGGNSNTQYQRKVAPAMPAAKSNNVN